MIGLLEIIAGELVTGVTRFIAVSVKTFVLCLGTWCVVVLRGERERDFAGLIPLPTQRCSCVHTAMLISTTHTRSFGMMLVLENTHDSWLAQTDHCQRLDINNRSVA